MEVRTVDAFVDSIEVASFELWMHIKPADPRAEPTRKVDSQVDVLKPRIFA
jgi:hypothetical protein